MAEQQMDSPHWAEPDVLIIGAGASGAAVAWSLAAGGMHVVCLEQGDWVDPAGMPGHGADWELRRLNDFSPDPNVRQLPADYPVNGVASAYTPLMFNAVGGSTIHWSGHFPRFHPSDFRVRSLDGVADDWPLTYEELAPFYEANDALIGVSGLAGDPAYPARTPRQTPPLPLGPMGETIARGFDRLGWHWWPSDAAIITAPYGPEGNNRQPCNNCGPCDLGCPIGAMSSAHVTYWPQALRLGVELRTRCRVREITVDSAGRARGALYYDAEGRLREQTAPVVIVACNGIGTPRLLLNSASRHFPDGLANRSGIVGKNLMYHTYAAVGGRFPEPLESYKGPSGACILSHEFYETNPSQGFVRGYQLQVGRESGPVSLAHGGFVGQPLPWGRDHHAAFAAHYGHTANLGVMGEDLPEECNAVTLDPVLTDAHGIPAPLVRYRLGENSLKMLEHGVARAGEVLRAAGATEVWAENPRRRSGWHLLGTCRMGDDPARSVVDRWGRAHDVPNLFLVDGSIFVTSAVGNPTTTIQALALRTADHIRRERGNLEPAAAPARVFPAAPVPPARPGACVVPIGNAAVLTAKQRATLTAALNRLVPAHAALPAAGDLGVTAKVEASLAANALLRRQILDGLLALELACAQQGAGSFAALADEEQDAALQALAAAEPVFLALLLDHTYRGYYTNERVQRALNVGAVQPHGYQLPVFDPELLRAQRDRAPFWRKTS